MSLAARLMKHKEKEESREDSIYKARAQFIIGKKNMDKRESLGRSRRLSLGNKAGSP